MEDTIKQEEVVVPQKVKLLIDNEISRKLTKYKIITQDYNKPTYIYYFLELHPGKTLIFCSSVFCVQHLSHLLELLGFEPIPVHAFISPEKKWKNLKRFSEEESGILITTDTSISELNLPFVKHIYHYQAPKSYDSYIQRLKITKKLSAPGNVILLVNPNEMRKFSTLCQILRSDDSDVSGFPIETHFMEACEERTELAKKFAQWVLDVSEFETNPDSLNNCLSNMDVMIPKDVVNRIMKGKTEDKKNQLKQILEKPIIIKNRNGLQNRNILS